MGGGLHFAGSDGGRAWRLLHERPCEVLCIGASVTAQKDGWADRFVALAAARSGQAHRLVKNAMGGVGLLFGVANHAPAAPGSAPRVAFVEFSTGDLNLGLTPLDQLGAWLDELFRRLHAEDAAVVLVHNWRADFDVDDAPGIRRRHDEAAARRGVPVIGNHRLAAAAIDADGTTRERWFRDVCHTQPAGAEAYAGHVLACLQAMAESADGEAHAAAVPGEDTAPPAQDALADALEAPPPIAFVDPPAAVFDSPDVASGDYTYVSTLQRFPVRVFAPGSALELEVSGTLLGVAFLSGPRTGWVAMTIDGQPVRRFRCFDRNSFYERYVLLPSVFELRRSTLRLYEDGSAVDFAMAAKPHPEFALPRVMKLVQLAGRGLEVHGGRVLRLPREEAA